MADANVQNIEQVVVQAPKPPAPDGIAMPDHPIRHNAVYQAFDRLWRPTAGWVMVGGLAYAFIVGPIMGQALPEGYLALELTFAGGMLGLKTLEKIKAVA